MKPPHSSDMQRENLIFRRRVILASVIVFLGLVGLIVRYAYLQIYTHDQYVTQSDNNRIKLVSAPPSRGYIYDRNGVILADNQPVFTAVISPDEIDNPDNTLALLTPIFQLTPEEISEASKPLKKVKTNLSPLKSDLPNSKLPSLVNANRFLKG